MTSTRLLASAALAAAAAAAGCSSGPEPVYAFGPDELALRASLGIPIDASRVVLFAQNAHLDIDWQKTFDGYYEAYVEDIFIEARHLLETEPRAFYSIAEMAFLEHHLAAHPEELAPLRAAAARGALRIVGGGVTSPDTLLPESELLFREFLHGNAFAEDVLGVRPRAAWLPDSFGHAASVPDVLAAAGYDSVAFSRIDGAPTLFDQLILHALDPKPGSTAEALRDLASADFVWRGPGGGEVQAHFMAAIGLYCTGDNIDYAELIEVAGGHTGSFEGDVPSFTDGRIDGYAAMLEPYGRTPYRFVPVGCDFQHPKERLVEYLDGYNARRYPETGVWAVAAPFDDYAALVGFWQDHLPRLEGDLTPYFQGFYGSRAAVKRGIRAAARPFFVAETFACALGDEGRALVAAAAPELELLVRSNHHDFVPGTSADDVVATEQLPLLSAAEAAGRGLLDDVTAALGARIPATAGASFRLLALNAASAPGTAVAEVSLPLAAPGVAPDLHAEAGGVGVPLELVAAPGPTDTEARVRLALAGVPPFGWRTINLVAGGVSPAAEVGLELTDVLGAPAVGAAVRRVVVSNAHVRAEWQKPAGGVPGTFALRSLTVDGEQAIAGPSFGLHDYADTGGLWRTGNEMPGCALTALGPPVDDETVEVLTASRLAVRVAFHGTSSVREAALGAGETGLELVVTTGAAQATTRTVGFSFATAADAPLRTSMPAGSAERPPERIYAPTFWPAVDYALVGGWAILLRQSTGVRMSEPGEVELMAARDAREEQCDILGGTGSDPGTHRIEWRILRAATPAAAARAAQGFNRPLVLARVGTTQAAATDLPAELSLATPSGEGLVSALKPALRGEGIILRALGLPGPLDIALPAMWAGASRTAVDLAERDGAPLEGGPGTSLTLEGAIESVRLR